jgi:hypothetical protein
LENEFVTSLIITVATQIPSLLIWVIGISLSVYFRQRNPKKSLLTTIAFMIFLLNTIGSSVFSTWIMMNFVATGEPLPGLSQMAFSLLSTLSVTIAWVILLFAIFSSKFNSVEVLSQ